MQPKISMPEHQFNVAQHSKNRLSSYHRPRICLVQPNRLWLSKKPKSQPKTLGVTKATPQSSFLSIQNWNMCWGAFPSCGCKKFEKITYCHSVVLTSTPLLSIKVFSGMLKQHTWVILRRLGMDSISLRWFGSSSLAIQYQPLYTIVNEKESTIVDCWDGVNLKFTCRRILSAYVMRMWEEIIGITGAINLSKKPDSVVWP